MSQVLRSKEGVVELLVPAVLSRGEVTRFLSELEAVAGNSPRILVLRGATSGFCRGMDLDEVALDGDSAPKPNWQLGTEDFVKILAVLRDSNAITLAVVEGPALGGGVGLAAACDFVVATNVATFALPELLMGLVPAMILPLLIERLGLQPAKRWAMTQATWTAEAAKVSGLVDHLVQVERLDVELKRLVRSLLRSHPRGVMHLKQLLNEVRGMPLGAAIERGQVLLAALLGQAEVRRELVAFRDYGLLPGEAEQ